MQMVATSKMRKTQERMSAARPYAENVRRVMANIAHIGSYTRNSISFLRSPSETKSVGIILITTDKGLCGGLNTNTLKVFYDKVKEFHHSEAKVEVCSLGHKGLNVVSSGDVVVVSTESIPFGCFEFSIKSVVTCSGNIFDSIKETLFTRFCIQTASIFLTAMANNRKMAKLYIFLN
jgi:ATP synthase F1 gamma subunit